MSWTELQYAGPQESVLREQRAPVDIIEYKEWSHGSSGGAHRSSGPRRRSRSQIVFSRDILYRAINEYQLSGSMLSAYTELLKRLRFDLTPVVAGDQTWYLCRGKSDDDSPCQRLVPEEYLRAAVGMVLEAAEKPELTGDYLVEELAKALSHAICSEHHPTIHKIARAIEARQVIEQWRTGRAAAGSGSTPLKAVSVEPSTREATSPGARWSSRIGTLPSNFEADDDDTVASINREVERLYRDYLRAADRGHHSVSNSPSSTASGGK